MTKRSWKHRLSEIDDFSQSGVCSNCGEVPLRYLRTSTSGKRYYRCLIAVRAEKTLQKRPYRIFVEETCSRCGFIPEHPSQLDVDHIDGNNQNNSPSNLQTLCANCHRLKTIERQDWGYTRLPGIAL